MRTNQLNRFFLTLAAACPLLLCVPMVQAAPQLTLQLSESGVAGNMSKNSGDGYVQFDAVSFGDFIINTISGTGAPLMSVPSLDLQTLNVSSANLSGPKTLTIQLTETGLTSAVNPLSIMSAFTGNLGSGVQSETISSYLDPSNTKFGTTDLLGTMTFTKTGSNSTNQLANVTLPTGGTFSESIIISATFGATSGSSEILNSSGQLSSATPEPSSIALLGTGLLGFAFTIRRRIGKRNSAESK